ncbi:MULTISPECIES: MarR family winged helix-turn-helix transcriptional regulator [unclassified Streptomyces]|uniref:MarR family winged helix-turn-helix transcriptional regulator n=1 Tax=unclassified Streptomyces TaxID=2593676 RepID=UPI000F49639C|nr:MULTISPECIES: MarR family transcriptional regulator [unclassified Streptomyces]MCX4771808.1 MarR family transcriptional regulator [Streptomyces sp. NBC_01285]ROQ80835.1 DNA-binding MarR family transcriptional regulator [Streptomyces sp. CEV 2-1]
MSPTPTPEPTPARLRTIPSRLLAGAAAVADRLVSERLAAEGAHKWHFAVLIALDEAGAASQAGLSRRTGIYRSDMVAVLNELADAQCVRREPDPADRRRNVITLTPAGRRRLERLDTLIADAQRELLAPLTPGGQDELIRLLTVLTEHHQPPHPRPHDTR